MENIRAVIIFGSSRSDGNTARLSRLIQDQLSCDVIDLADYSISYFDYEHRNKVDDFLPLMRKIVANYDMLIFATPVYWYAMSGIMKVFFDRISDLLKIDKPTGRLLRGKMMAVVSNSNSNELGSYFWEPFRLSAEYLGMKYLGDMHLHEDEISDEKVRRFIQDIME